MAELPAPPLGLRLLASLVRRLPAGRYRAMNLVRRGGPFAARLPAALGGARFACDLRDLIAREAFLTGLYGAQETALLRAILRPGGTFVDVGANWGYFTLLAAHLVGRGGRIVAFEPDPRLFRLLEANLAANGIRTAEALPVAAADRAGTLSLAGHDADAGNWGLSSLVAPVGSASHNGSTPFGGSGSSDGSGSSASPDRSTSSDRSASSDRSTSSDAKSSDASRSMTFEVRAERIDDVLDGISIDHVDLLKLDVEGAEDLALAGMEGGLARGRYRRVLVEVHPMLRGPGIERRVTDAFRAAGYRGWRVDHSPEATRRAAYAADADARSLLRPIDEAGDDPWPHHLWTAPGEEPL